MSTPAESGNAGAEDEESSSSSSSLSTTPILMPTRPDVATNALHTMSNDFRSALEEFRDSWRRELNQTESFSQSESKKADTIIEQSSHISISINEAEQQAFAESLFHKAVELEQRGKVYDALPFYRKALQIVPDIEFRFYEQTKLRTALPAAVDTAATKPLTQHRNDNDCEEELADDLYEKFQMDLAHNYGGKLLLSSRDNGVISTELHISVLPPEIILYILRWVVSAQLDMRSLEQCAAVCRGMYLCARDEDIWKLACLRVWGVNLGTINEPIVAATTTDISQESDSRAVVYISWRQMFIERERVLFSGCYISKTTYLRMGENSFQDQYYRPVQLVEYFRYVRFLADGTVLMMTNADEPAQGVNKLKNLQHLRPDVLHGHYRLLGSTVTMILKKNQRFNGGGNTQQQYIASRQRRGSIAFGYAGQDEPANTTYCIEFRIMNTPKRRFCQLMWVHYSITQTRNKVETSCDFDLTPSKYPPLWFSPVRSYHLDSDEPLA